MGSENQMSIKFTPRGEKMMLPHGGHPETISSYMLELISKTGGENGPLGKQFIAQPGKEIKYSKTNITDPLIEDEYETAPGLVYKYRGKVNNKGELMYYGRALWTITRYCAAYCRFCTRAREVGLPPDKKLESKCAIAQKPFLTEEDISKVINYLHKHKEINEIIVSGGDPLTAPYNYLEKIISKLAELQKNGNLDVIRIGTRIPISNPCLLDERYYKLISKIKNPYIMVHINHPFELTEEAVGAMNRLRKECRALILSQTVLLKGINDSEKILYDLFVKMVKEGIRPYYVFQNDPVYWARHFTVPIRRAIKIWGNLRPKLSGLAATARFVIDTPFGFGKIPIPEGNAWKVDYKSFYDFKKEKHKLENK